MKVLSRQEEDLVFMANSMANLGPKTYGVFDGGRLEQFVPSTRCITTIHFNDEQLLRQFAAKLARYHCLKVPIAKQERNLLQLLSDHYYTKFNAEKFTEFCQLVGVPNYEPLVSWPWRQEVAWLQGMERKLRQRVVLVHGDAIPNNWLVLEQEDMFGDNVMLIDYEVTGYEPRGRDLATIMNCYMFLVDDGELRQVADYPNEIWRQKFIGHYIDEFKRLAPNDLIDDLDTVDHVMMECEFNFLVNIHFYIAYVLQQDRNSYILRDRKFAKSWVETNLKLVHIYFDRKAYFINKYKDHVTS